MYVTFWRAPEEDRRRHKTPWTRPCRGREPLSAVAKVSTLMLRKKAVTPSTEPSSLLPPKTYLFSVKQLSAPLLPIHLQTV